jgi:branched-chain amino acid transport system permease protein
VNGRKSIAGIALCAAALLALPYATGSEYLVNVSSQILIFALLALSLNMVVGMGGMTSLGHAAYLGLSAYACAWLTSAQGWSPLAAAAAALAFSTSVAALFGVLALRVSGISFLMITLAFGQIVWGVAYRWVSLTNGDNGIKLEGGRPSPFGIDISGVNGFYYFTLAIFTLALYAMWRFSRSPFGACLRGVRDQPRRMSMLGHNVWLVRWSAFVLSGFWGSVAGLLYVYYNQFISPHAVALQQSAEVLLMVILGGATSLTGPIVGAIIITLVKNVLSSYIERWYSVLGLIFIVTVIFMPQGLVPGVQHLLTRRWRVSKSPAKPRSIAQESAQ